jgi:hypothetical protein
MQSSQPSDDKSPNNAKAPRGSLALRLNRAASDLNPILMVLAIGLSLLDITLYLGMSAARQSAWMAPHQIGAHLAAPAAAAAPEPSAYSRQ